MDKEGWTLAIILCEKLDSILSQGQLDSLDNILSQGQLDSSESILSQGQLDSLDNIRSQGQLDSILGQGQLLGSAVSIRDIKTSLEQLYIWWQYTQASTHDY